MGRCTHRIGFLRTQRGLNGHFQRRGLLRFKSPAGPAEGYRFTRISTGDSVDLFYDPQKITIDHDPDEPFQLQWRKRVKAILAHPEAAITCVRHKSGEVHKEPGGH